MPGEENVAFPFVHLPTTVKDILRVAKYPSGGAITYFDVMYKRIHLVIEVNFKIDPERFSTNLLAKFFFAISRPDKFLNFFFHMKMTFFSLVIDLLLES